MPPAIRSAVCAATCRVNSAVVASCSTSARSARGSVPELSRRVVDHRVGLASCPTRDLRAAEHFNAFFFAPAFAKGVSLSTLFSTHPTLERRLQQLTELEAQMGRAA